MSISKRNHSSGIPRPKTTSGWTQCGNTLIPLDVTADMIEDSRLQRLYNDNQRPFQCSQCTTTTWRPGNGQYTCSGTVWK